MKITVVGFGQCGNKIADVFARQGKKARKERGIEIVTDAFAVNTDTADLSGLSCIKSDHRHRILIGALKTAGHGVGKINEVAAEVARNDADKVIDAIRGTKRFYESDAFLLIASTAGGTGSGSIPVLTQMIKEKYRDKPVYALLILPFEHEEQTDGRTIYNTSLCLKSVGSVADAIILVDNQRFIKKDSSLRNNMAGINELVVEPFYDLLCAGEEKKPKHIGARLLDAGDIMQTLSGWTTLGYGKLQLPLFRLPFEWKPNYRGKIAETHNGIQVMDEAISELSLECSLKDSNRALYLLSAPASEMNMDLVKELGEYLAEVSPGAIIRCGDYPRRERTLTITVILSQFTHVDKIKNYYDEFPNAMKKIEKIESGIEVILREFEEASFNIPSLLK
jgi:cell division GTPase FtsZ